MKRNPMQQQRSTTTSAAEGTAYPSAAAGSRKATHAISPTITARRQGRANSLHHLLFVGNTPGSFCIWVEIESYIHTSDAWDRNEVVKPSILIAIQAAAGLRRVALIV